MAFGNSMTKQAERKNTATDTDGQKYEHQWVDLHAGTRVVRLLPSSDDARQPEEEVRWAEVWLELPAGGYARVMLDWQNPWNNPIWSFVQAQQKAGVEAFQKGKEQYRRMMPKQRFGINVLDKTPVVFDEDGNVIYPNEKGVMNTNARGKIVGIVPGEPKPLNRVRILEGSAGQKDGKHLLQQFIDTAENIEDNEGNQRGLAEVDIRVRTTGTGIDTKRSLFPLANFKPLTDEEMSLPRYDIAAWAKPWPNEMIERLMDGEDLAELVQEFGIVQFPQLKEVTAPKEASPLRKATNHYDDDDDENAF